MTTKIMTAQEMDDANKSIPVEVRQEVEHTIFRLYPPSKREVGTCYEVWTRIAELFEAKGYRWYSPAEIHPEADFAPRHQKDGEK